ncbi:MAG: ABC transporter ATP-binding protein [Nitrososphaerota archaeon]
MIGSLITENLTKVYSDHSGKKALDTINITIPIKGIFALIGRNGAGKTTLVRILATQLMPTSGFASVDGLDIVKDAKYLRNRIACVPQEARPIAWMTPKQTILSYLMWRGYGYGEAKVRAQEALARVGIDQVQDKLNRTLSGGTKRKVLVATALASEADIIFLDEPTTGLDPVSRRDLWNYLLALGKERFTILTTHYLEEAEQLATLIGILDRGKLIGIGSLEELRKMVRYQYSIRMQGDSDVLSSAVGEIARGRDGSVQLLTTEDEAIRLSHKLLELGSRFSMSPVTLDDVFFHVVNKEEMLQTI